MRLICPNCDAEYEVDASVIPDNGRDVQCSSCGHAWYQMPLDVLAAVSPPTFEPPPAMTAAPAPTPAPPVPPVADPPAPARPRALEESVLSVLREEAERETAARRAEAPPAPIETQEELSLDDAHASNPATAAVVNGPDRAFRRDLLPDIEEINSTLRPADSAGVAVQDRSGEQRRGGFRSGFVLMLVLAALVVALYVLAPALSQQLPGAAPALAKFVATVDTARLWLDGQMTQVIGALDGRPAQ